MKDLNKRDERRGCSPEKKNRLKTKQSNGNEPKQRTVNNIVIRMQWRKKHSKLAAESKEHVG